MKQKKHISLWHFTGNNGAFVIDNPQDISRLYFPLGNEQGLMSSITPDLHGDIKTGQNNFLLQPISEYDLHNLKSKRDFWLSFKPGNCISLTDYSQGKNVRLEGGFLYQRLSADYPSYHLQTEITNFVPATGEPIELMKITIKNKGKKSISFIPTAAIPIYGRSADNLRDHRHVTSLLQRLTVTAAGVMVTPTMSFDERGHTVNTISYIVQGCAGDGSLPAGAFPTVEEFSGEGGDFSRPKSIVEQRPPTAKKAGLRYGKEAMGALQFKKKTLRPGQEISYILMMGITSDSAAAKHWLKTFGDIPKFNRSLMLTRAHWQERLNHISFRSNNTAFDNWIQWVMLQPILRKIFGNSFLPDHDYGRGGRGWRDLWQDLLALILIQPQVARDSLINNFAGVRIDGTNATIIGRNPGEFIADRNNITRVWMDHGTWPFLTLELYLHQTGDFDILFAETPYFRDPQLKRSREKDTSWTPKYGLQLKSKSGAIYQGSIFEHILVQHLVQFFNVGEHNLIRLEDADWNDGMDMAHERGESVAFSALYAGNLNNIADILEECLKRKNYQSLQLAQESFILLDTISSPIDYNSVTQKQKLLQEYFAAVSPEVSGEKKGIPLAELIADFRQKATWLTSYIQKTEWLTVKDTFHFYNGYYNNDGERVEGEHPKGPRLTLTGQVFPILGNVATESHITEIFRAAKKFLQDKKLQGFRLNTDFHEIQLNLGRAFSFAYGEKENGAFFNHMCVMFAYGLYVRGFVNEGYTVLSSIFKMAADSSTSKIYPGIPEYFNSAGRGMYHYLTGSASWFMVTLLQEVCGIKGWYGNLLLSPKFAPAHLKELGNMSVVTQFAGKKIEVNFCNPKKLSYGFYEIRDITMNGAKINYSLNKKAEALIFRSDFLHAATKETNSIEITLS